jgi:hypothetical protein
MARMLPNRVLDCKVAGLIFAWIGRYFGASFLSTGNYEVKKAFYDFGK